ncbi:hypothetical protein ACFW04_013771 [Cataglyphis niger]
MKKTRPAAEYRVTHIKEAPRNRAKNELLLAIIPMQQIRNEKIQMLYDSGSTISSIKLKHLKDDTPIQDEKIALTGHLNIEEKQAFLRICEDFCDIFHVDGEPLTCAATVEHEINTRAITLLVNVRSYRLPKKHKTEVNKQVQQMLELYGPTQLRVVIDFRKLNDLTIGDSFPLPNITDILDQLGNAKYFTTLDLASGYHQIPMTEKDKNKTAFSTPYGHYEFNRIPFGLKNAPATFQRLMNSVLIGMQGLKCLVYLDDIVIYGSSLEDRNKWLKEILQRLRENNLKLQPDKCEFLRKEAERANANADALSRNVIRDTNEIKEEEREILAIEEETHSDEEKTYTEEKKKYILYEFHDALTGGHQGIERTIRRICLIHKWPGLTKDVERYIAKCEYCQKNKLSRKNKVPLIITDTPTKPFEKSALDIVGPLTVTTNGNKYLLTFQDNLTKFSKAIPIPNQKANTVSKEFITKTVLEYGIPDKILTDQGTNFLSEIFKNTNANY